MEEEKYWLCPNNHILGIVKRDGSGIRKLSLFRNAIEISNVPDFWKAGKVMGKVEGQMEDIECSICGETRTWEPGEESIRALLERVKGKGKAE